MKTFTTLCFIGAALLAIASTAHASERLPRGTGVDQVRRAFVYVADLDLGRRADAQTLYERIRYAAHTLCSYDEPLFDASKQRHWRECVESAMDGAIQRVNAPLLMALHLQQREQLATL